jgi:hypothetical protein
MKSCTKTRPKLLFSFLIVFFLCSYHTSNAQMMPELASEYFNDDLRTILNDMKNHNIKRMRIDTHHRYYKNALRPFHYNFINDTLLEITSEYHREYCSLIKKTDTYVRLDSNFCFGQCMACTNYDSSGYRIFSAPLFRACFDHLGRPVYNQETTDSNKIIYTSYMYLPDSVTITNSYERTNATNVGLFSDTTQITTFKSDDLTTVISESHSRQKYFNCNDYFYQHCKTVKKYKYKDGLLFEIKMTQRGIFRDKCMIRIYYY